MALCMLMFFAPAGIGQQHQQRAACHADLANQRPPQVASDASQGDGEQHEADADTKAHDVQEECGSRSAKAV